MPPKKVAKNEERKEEPEKEPEKRKSEEAKSEEEPVKKEPKVEQEEKVEQEKDDPIDSRVKIKDPVVFNANDMSLNVVPAMDGKLLTAFNEGGLQYLIAGARANVGIKAGRYLFEAKILEVLNPPEVSNHKRPPMPRQLLRIGFSTAGSQLVLGEHGEHVCFDSDGCFYSDKKKKPLGKGRFVRDQAVGVLLNLDPKSPSKNTVSLFVNGERTSEPQPLPEALHGKVLYPHVGFRNISVLVPFASSPLKALPFKCRTVQDAAKPDVLVKTVAPKSEYKVVFPVGFPDEGTFDWLDAFIKKNPDFVELSDRAIMDWATSSGIYKWKTVDWKNSNDRPDFNFGLPGMDDGSIRRVINLLAPVTPRNYVVMEVKQNLTAADRIENLQRFSAPHYKKIAHVAMGEPNAEYKKMQLEQLLKDKQEKAEAAWKNRRAEAERKKRFEAARKKKAGPEATDSVKMELKEGEAKEGEANKDGEDKKGEGKQEEEAKEEDKDDTEEAKEDATVDVKNEEDIPEEPPTVELTDEDKKMWFRPRNPSDLSQSVLNASFDSFSVPTKSEGFDDVVFEWCNDQQSSKYLKTWVLEKKRTSKVEDLKPGQWFHDKISEWQKQFAELQEKSELSDVGNGQPLCKQFQFEDWAMVQLRFELYLLMAAFKKDVNDPERIGIHEAHLTFYFNKYFKKQLMPKYFGVTSNAELTALVADTAVWSDQQVLTTPVAQDVGLDMFIRLAEEKRRERQRRLDAGDETARLKFMPQAMAGKGAALVLGKGQQIRGLQQAAAASSAAALLAAAAAATPAAGGTAVSGPLPVGPAPPNAFGQGQQKGGFGANRSTPYGQGAYGQGGFKGKR